ncbi:carboxymuconolactone decarboxylase family protein [Magnetovibrio sp.]|uniref:carboxymuconolactone decarboxylase family protein n=1 Tax=Magnetovibrio sp. TaxID=2024836 RepID=UPI002F926F4A
MLSKDRIDLRTHAPVVMGTFEKVEGLIGESGLDAMLRHLVKLRVSQINGCAYCVEMHTREAREDGETDRRLDHLVVWREVNLFTDAEKAALAWAEALTVLGNGVSLDDLHDQLRQHFSDEDIATLCTVIVMINTWNRLQVASHNARF